MTMHYWAVGMIASQIEVASSTPPSKNDEADLQKIAKISLSDYFGLLLD